MFVCVGVLNVCFLIYSFSLSVHQTQTAASRGGDAARRPGARALAEQGSGSSCGRRGDAAAATMVSLVV